MTARLRHILGLMRESARLMVGAPSYPAYCKHMAEQHPDCPIMSERDFFRDRQEARYGGKGGGGRCC